MNTNNTYRYGLDKSSKKFICPNPQCRQRRFVLYVDFATGNYVSEKVGRCDRENSCGYHYTPKQFFEDSSTKVLINNEKAAQILEIDSIPLHFLEKSVNPKFYLRNHFFLFLTSVFGKTIAYDLSRKYLIGTSEYWKGATVFWQTDETERIRQCKIMLYNAVTGKRIRKGETVFRYDKLSKTHISEITKSDCVVIYGKFIGDVTKNMHLVQCFFGQELLRLFPDKPVCIVESEKTAIICSVYLPQFLWLATGGSNGCKWREYEVYKCLSDRSVTFFPDFGNFKQDGTTCYDEWRDRVKRIKEALNNPNIKVSDVLERALNGQPRDGRDLADLLLIRDETAGLALTQDGYPIMWDFKADM